MAAARNDRLSSMVPDDELNDQLALRHHSGEEHLFNAKDNKFAFSPGVLRKLVDPKSLPAFHACGGLRGLERGLRTNRLSGLSQDETDFEEFITFEDAVLHARAPPDNDFESTVDSYRREGSVNSDSSGRTGDTQKTTRTQTLADQFVARKKIFGVNRVPERKGKSIWQLLWKTWSDKMLMLLTLAALSSLGLGIWQQKAKGKKACKIQAEAEGEDPAGWIEGIAILTAVTIVVIVSTWNDWKRERQFARLNAKKSDRPVTVIRSGKQRQISVYELLVGDVIQIAPGEVIPADGVFISGYNVSCDESTATGESDLVHKTPGDYVYDAIHSGVPPNIQQLDPFMLSGAQVNEGTGTYLVTAVGVHTMHGRTLMALREESEITPLQQKLNLLGDQIAKLGGLASLALFIALFIKFLVQLKKRPNGCKAAGKFALFLDIFIEAVSLVVCAVPEGLPLAVTISLAYATRKMLGDNNLVRHLQACETMGNATAICSDKTGTLTENNMTLVATTIGLDKSFNIDNSSAKEAGTKVSIDATEWTRGLCPDVLRLVAQSIVVNSSAYEDETNSNGINFVGSKTETALLRFARSHLNIASLQEERSNANIVQVQPFDSSLKFMATAVKLANDKYRLYVKGAPEIMLQQATHRLARPETDTSTVPLSDVDRDQLGHTISDYASQSLRTLAMLYQDLPAWPPLSSHDAENPVHVDFDRLIRAERLVWLGVFGIKDPLRDGVAEAVKSCQRAGVVVRMVTGDNYLTARAIATECGIYRPNSDDIIVEGPKFRKMDDAAMAHAIPRLRVLARSSPEDKRILVKQLLSLGETVAVTGDGTNDAPALHTADVGFAMGVSGTEVAKEASDIVIMDDNFSSIVKALL